MQDIKSLLKENAHYRKDGNTVHFIMDEEARPAWSRALNNYLVENKVDLKMAERYEEQSGMAKADEKRRRFYDFVSALQGVKVDLASGPSGYFAPILETLRQTDTFIASDACPAVIAAHSAACGKENFYVFDMDLDQSLPFADGSVDVFCGNLLNNVDNYKKLLQEIYRCLKPGGRFAVIEIFYEQGSKTYEHLISQGSVWASLETYVKNCENLGMKQLDSDTLSQRKGKIAKGDLYPLDENDCWEERAVYFEKQTC